MCALLLGACSHFQEHSHHQTHQTSAEYDSDPDSTPIPMNGDNKWLMDQHTRQVFADMHNKTQGIRPAEMSTPERHSLGEDLDRDLEKLIQGCTMQGAAHDALHQYLSKLIPSVASLKSQGKQAQAERVQQLLSSYQDYFE
jgi:hypothetical protein